MEDYHLGVYDFAGKCVIQPEHSPDGWLLTAPVYSFENDALFCFVETPESYFRYYFYDFSHSKSVMIDIIYARIQGWDLTELVDPPDYWIG